MATAQQPQTGAQDQRIVLRNVSWETYERLVAEHESAGAPRFTYDRGELEIMSPRPEHEELNRAVALLVALVAEALDIDARDLGSTTFRREDIERGFEPDTCFYIQHEGLMRGKRSIDLRVDPPPDLVIEIDVSQSSIDKLSLFSTMRVPEVWRVDDGEVVFLGLEGDSYVSLESSRSLPGVTVGSVTTLLSFVETTGMREWMGRVRRWAESLPQE